MYFIFVILTTCVLPIVSTALEAHGQLDVVYPALALKWFVVWGVGVRLGAAGLRQLVQPKFTARDIFRIDSEAVVPIVRELGISNLAAGIVALLSLAAPTFAAPIAIWASCFFGGAALGHLKGKHRTARENVALATDLLMFVVLGASLIGCLL